MYFFQYKVISLSKVEFFTSIATLDRKLLVKASISLNIFFLSNIRNIQHRIS